MAARGQIRSGLEQVQEWKIKQEHLERLASGFVEAALETCQLYDIPLTESMCSCFLSETENSSTFSSGTSKRRCKVQAIKAIRKA